MNKRASDTDKPAHPWNDNIRTIILAVLLALTFRSLAYEPFHIPSGSMKDTLLIGDYIFVSKYQYGYSRYSFPLGLDLFDGRIISDNRPKRGEVVVFRLPSKPRIDYIKRVIGLPGDTVQIVDGVVYINDVAVPRTRIEDYTEYTSDNRSVTVRRYEETLPDGKVHHTLDTLPYGEVDNTYVYTVPDGHYFMMGDNRDNSMDSRYTEEVGFIPESHLIGRAEMIFFSVDERTNIWKVWDWVWALRTDRFFKVID